MWRWSRSKTRHCVGLEVAYIVLSLVFEKKTEMAKELVKMIRCRDVCYPPQEFDARGESTLTTGLYDTLSVP